jgi:hypothetical protein
MSHLGLAFLQMKCHIVTFYSKKVFKKEGSGVDVQSVGYETKFHSARSETKDIAVGGCLVVCRHCH